MNDGPVIYGRFDINWCENCNVPIFKDQCGKCGDSAEKIELTPPGDVGPSFREDLVRDVVEENFGIDGGKFFPKNQVKLMNPVPGVDDAYELVVDGMILGQIRFEPEEKKWRLVLNMEGAIRIYLLGTDKKIVEMHESASEYLKDGANALSPGVTDADPEITPGDECIVVEEGERDPSKVLGTGLAKMNGREMVEKDYGTSVSTRGQKKVDYKNPEKSGAWDDVIEANEDHLKEIEKEAINFIRETKEKKNLPVCVSFSGGKDSLAVLLLVRKALNESEYDILYNDTGIEFPETTEYIHELEQEMEKEVEIAEGDDPFWDNIEDFGPPGKDYRWCCKTCKLGPIGNYIDEKYDGSEEKVLTFGGGRKFESDNRSKRDRVSKNPWVPGQISGMPIQNWRSLEVWLYIYQNDLPHNELYDKLERIGCWVCPSSSLAELETLKENHPDLWKKFRTRLDDFAQRRGLPEEWIEYGFWRWENLPSSQKDLVNKLGLDPSDLEFKRYEEEISVKKHGKDRWILEGNFSLEEFERVAPILGEYEVDEDEKGNKIFKFSDGLKLSKNAIEGNMSQRKEGLLALKKAQECVGCKSCQAICSQSAIHFNDGKIVIEDSCVGCGDCFDNCPLKFKI